MPEAESASSPGPDTEPAKAPVEAVPGALSPDEEPLLGEPTARLLEYLKGLADQLPPEKKEEFDVSGFKSKIDDLIGKIKQEAERSREPPPVIPRESGFGLLSAGQALRAADPRRAAEGRRSLQERRAVPERRDEKDRRKVMERRTTGERREKNDRRGGERREPVPEIDLSEPIPKEAAPVTKAPDGTPTEIAGIAISPRMARLIQMMKRGKKNG